MTDTDMSPTGSVFRYRLTDPALVFACYLLAGTGTLIFNAYPIVLGTLADRYGLGDAQMGILGSAFMAGAATIALIAPWWVARLSWQLVSMIAAVMILGAVAIFGITATASWAYFAMAICGCGSVVFYTLSLTILSRHANPERVYGWKFAVEMSTGAVFVVLMTKFVIANFGFNGFIVGMALVYIALLLPIVKIPENFVKQENRQEAARGDSDSKAGAAPWLAILALFMGAGIFYSMWAFMEKIGLRHGANPEFVETAIAITIVASIAGAVLVGWIGNRWRQIGPLVVILTGWVAATYLLWLNISGTSFLLGSCILMGLFMAWSAYQWAFIGEVDTGGHVILLIPFAVTFSGIFGPSIGGLLIENFGYGMAFLCWGSAMAGVIGLNLLAWALHPRSLPSAPVSESLSENA